ncbi:testis-expressed protein 11-like [Corticium candelabrum]|uniref:testis-expressed protein 11-like n=1 Tax=Corticium candelabrum TaxID=121492 RepID=UPI002E25A93D|nr:testis-expressed protein 11-like [Corticium candelabrum]
MLSYNFGVDMFHRKKFDACVSWLRESYELGKCRRDVGPRKQSRTLRLLASSYMEWNVKEHWQKALNAVGLANSEFSHPTGLRLKLSILLATHAKDSRISAAFEETLNHPELDVTTGLSTVELAVRHKQVDLAYSGFKQLSVQFQNSPDFEQIQISHLELLLMEQNTQAAQDLLSDVIRDQRLSESLTVSARKKIHKLLWQQASAVCEAEQPAKALEWYDLSLRLFTKEELDSSNAAKLQRNRATCFISIADFKSAHDAILEAERSDSTNPITYYLKFKMNLLQGNSDSAVEAIEEMCNTLAAHQEISSAGSDDSNALISLAAQLAFEKSNHVAAEKALECLTERLRNDSQKLTTLRCLTRLKLSLLTDQSNTSAVMSISYYITTALETLSTTGKEKLNEDVYENETKWFMKIAWNLALQCQNSTKEMYDLIRACQKLAKLSRDHETSVTRQKTCLLLAAAAGLEMARQETNEKNKITTIVEVLHHIEQCQQLQMQATSTASVSHSNTDTLLLLYEFEAKAQSDYPIKELYELLEKANTLPGADAKTFETLAGLAVQSPVPHTAELALAALDVSISRYTNSNDIDLVKCSKVFRGAIQLCLQKDMKDANYIKAWNYYQQVLEIVETDRNETYPEIEVLWLLTKAWNHGIRQYSGGQCRDAEQWCGLGMRLLSKLTSMKSNYETQMAGVYSEILSKVEEHSEKTNAKQ